MRNLKWFKSIILLFVAFSLSSIFILGCKDLIEPKTVPSVVTGEVSKGTATSATLTGLKLRIYWAQLGLDMPVGMDYILCRF